MTVMTEYIKQIGHDLTGLKVQTRIMESTGFMELYYTPQRIKIDQLYINFNRYEIDRISDIAFKRRGVILKYKYIYVILHEVAHYKKFKKFSTSNGYDDWTVANFFYSEALSDRYARRYAPKFIKEKRTDL